MKTMRLSGWIALFLLVACDVALPTVPPAASLSEGPTPIFPPDTPAASSSSLASIGGCPLFPANHVWNMPVDTLPLDPHSANYIDSIGRDVGLHPDFGSGLWDGGTIGIPYTTVLGSQPLVEVSFDYDDESDPGPYPIPADAPIEGGPDSDGDRHVLVVDVGQCLLYEMWNAWPQEDGSWHAGSGAVFDLRTNVLRPAGWTSADAAGLPILPGLVRYEEIEAGEIRHALRFTAHATQQAYLWPARHYASSDPSPLLPPMGQRFRLRASFDVSPYPAQVQVLLNALKTYGMILADNGSDWYLSGVPDERWDNAMWVSWLATVHGSDLEAVDESGCMVDPDSGAGSCFPDSQRIWLPLVAARTAATEE